MRLIRHGPNDPYLQPAGPPVGAITSQVTVSASASGESLFEVSNLLVTHLESALLDGSSSAEASAEVIHWVELAGECLSGAYLPAAILAQEVEVQGACSADSLATVDERVYALLYGAVDGSTTVPDASCQKIAYLREGLDGRGSTSVQEQLLGSLRTPRVKGQGYAKGSLQFANHLYSKRRVSNSKAELELFVDRRLRNLFVFCSSSLAGGLEFANHLSSAVQGRSSLPAAELRARHDLYESLGGGSTCAGGLEFANHLAGVSACSSSAELRTEVIWSETRDEATSVAETTGSLEYANHLGGVISGLGLTLDNGFHFDRGTTDCSGISSCSGSASASPVMLYSLAGDPYSEVVSFGVGSTYLRPVRILLAGLSYGHCTAIMQGGSINVVNVQSSILGEANAAGGPLVRIVRLEGTVVTGTNLGGNLDLSTNYPVFPDSASIVLEPLGPTTMRASWTPAFDIATPAGQLLYEVHIARTGGAPFSGSGITRNGVTTHVFAGLSPRTTYYVRVRATNLLGLSKELPREVVGVTLASAAPQIVNVSPSAGTKLKPSTPIVFDVVDDLNALASCVITIRSAKSNVTEVVFDGTQFSAYFQGISQRTPIAQGWRFSVKRFGGWQAGGLSFNVFAKDAEGNEA